MASFIMIVHADVLSTVLLWQRHSRNNTCLKETRSESYPIRLKKTQRSGKDETVFQYRD